MERAEFQYSITRAKDAAQSTKRLKGFWEGYQRGLRNFYHKKEHIPEVTEITSYETFGYQLGYSGMPFSEAYREITCCVVYNTVLKKYIKD